MTDYQKQANDFLEKTGASLEVKYLKTDKYFEDDKEIRDIYEVTLKRGTRIYTFTFGQSIAHSGKYHIQYGPLRIAPTHNLKEAQKWVSDKFGYHEICNLKPNPKFEEPDAYSILACLEKYELGSFEDFCSEFGYNDRPLSDHAKVMKIYEGCKEQYNSLEKLFSDEEMHELREIQ
jgi:hypothetical protein